MGTTSMSSKGDLSESELSLALWYTKHKVFLWRFLVFSLFFANLLILANLWYQWVTYMFQRRNDAVYEAGMVKNLIDFKTYQKRHAPLPLKMIDRGTVSSSRNLLDGYVLVENPNTTWMIERATILFTFANSSTTGVVENLPPASRQYVFFYGHPREQGVGFLPSFAQVDWRRVREPQPKVEEVFAITQQSINVVGAGSEHRATRAAFLLTNRSVSGFWQISVDVILFDYQNTVVGINSIIANAFQALETREMSVLWYEVLPPIQRFTVQISSRALSDTNRIRL